MTTPRTVLPRITVVATVYRREQFLAEALASALAQTRRDFELIVSDDSARPAIRAICESMGDDRIRYRANLPRLGVALNLRAALEEARGAYIAILNDDDAWEPQFLERLAGALDADERRAVAFCDHWLMDVDGRIDYEATTRTTRLYHRDEIPEGDQTDPISLVVRFNAVPMAMGAMFRRDCLPTGLLLPDVVGAYDFWISSQLAALGRPFYYVRERLTRYRTHPAMETARLAPDKSDNMVFVHRALLADPRFEAHRTILRRRLAVALSESAKDRLRFDQLDTARERFREALRFHASPRAAAGWLLTFAPRGVRRRLGFGAPRESPVLVQE
jgi:glycosyltransferase involved in cell wall biosynthesis